MIARNSYIRGFSSALNIFVERATLYIAVISYVLLGNRITGKVQRKNTDISSWRFPCRFCCRGSGVLSGPAAQHHPTLHVHLLPVGALFV